MKNLFIATMGLAFAALITVVMATPTEDGIIARIQKVGSVCLEGEACAGPKGAQAAAGGVKDPQAVYDRSCSTCHAIGIAGAPKWADASAWGPRIDKGMDVLYASGINGLAPGMPAKGMCFDCSDDDIKAVVDLMVAAAK